MLTDPKLWPVRILVYESGGGTSFLESETTLVSENENSWIWRFLFPLFLLRKRKQGPCCFRPSACVSYEALQEGPAGARATHDHVLGSKVVYWGGQESAVRAGHISL